MVYSLIVTIGTYAGDPIDCKLNNPDKVGKKFEKFLDEYVDYFNYKYHQVIRYFSVSSSYCFTHGTTTLKWPREGESHSTVGPLDCYEKSPTDCYESHPHYMWVPLVVLLQAGISYLPHFLWYYWEGETMER